MSPFAPDRKTMNGKPVLFRDAKTVLTFAKPFQEKLLCDGITLNLGDACVYSCAFCYVAPQMHKLLFRILAAIGLKHSEVVLRRKAALDILRSQLLNKKGNPKFSDPFDNSVVYSSTLVDIAGNMELVRETAEACNLIFKFTNWQIRLLTKSNLLPHLVQLIKPEWHSRLILGVSTGTLCDETAAAFEKGTPKVSKRIESLHWLQDRGFRTFGMICPSLPQEDYDTFAREMAEAIRQDRCEHVWAEVINLRGPSFHNTYHALHQAGKTKEAWMLAQVCGLGSKKSWEDYARQTFLAHTKYIPPQKLRFLQYVQADTLSFWKQYESKGVVLLGANAHKNDEPADTLIPQNLAPALERPAAKPLNRGSAAAKKAWETMRARYTPAQISERARKAAHKAWETMRAT
jgi:DNA repair photolyase